jgi:outer membrane protein
VPDLPSLPRLLLLLALLGPAGKVLAQPVPAAPLTLRAAAERALAAHPSLAALRARQEDAALATLEAEAGGRVAARWTTSLVENKEPMLVSPIHSFGPGQIPLLDETVFQSTLSATLTLWDAGARRARIDVAAAQAGAATAGVGGAEQQLLARLAGAYAQVLSRRQVLGAAEMRKDAVSAELGRVRQLFEVGKVAEVEILRAEASLAATEAELARLGSSLDLAERELARLIGASPEETRAANLQPLSTSADGLPPREDLVAAAAEKNPEAAAARQAIAASEAARRLARTAYYPDLKTTANLQEFASSDGHAATEWNAGFLLTVPLWDGGLTSRRVARAEVQISEARARLESARLEIASGIDRALASLDEARARRAALARAEERLVEVARVQRLLLDTGAGTQVDYLSAEAELASTRAALYEAEVAIVLARVELGRVSAELSPAFLESQLAAETFLPAENSR